VTKLAAFASCAVALALSACAEKWVKPGGTPEEFEAIKAACVSTASSQFPPMIRQEQYGAGYTTPVTTNCSGFGYSVQCFSTGGQYVPPITVTVDDNAVARNQAVRSCFYAHGWHPQSGESGSVGLVAMSPNTALFEECMDAKANDGGANSIRSSVAVDECMKQHGHDKINHDCAYRAECYN
jgi:hypothetical protein